AGEADPVVGAAPASALYDGTERQALVDVAECDDLVLAVVPAPAPEHADVVAHRLLDIDVVAVLGALAPGQANRLGRIEAGEQVDVDRLAVAAGEVGVGPDRHADLAVAREQRIAHLVLEHIGAAPEQ